MTSPDDIRIPGDTTLPLESAGKASSAKPISPAATVAPREIGAESEVRGGPEAPIDNFDLDSDSTIMDIDPALSIAHEQRIRECAYYLWQAAGEPEGSELEFWQQASAQLVR